MESATDAHEESSGVAALTAQPELTGATQGAATPTGARRVAGEKQTFSALQTEPPAKAEYAPGKRTSRGPDPEPTVSVIIPTLNEAQNLPHVFSELPHGLHEVIVVDGFSVDGTTTVARQLREDVKIVHQTQAGKGDALRCGFEVATGDVLVMLDADGSADPAEIPRFVAALLAGADFAKGSRFCEGGGSADITRIRSAGNRMLSGIVNVLFRTSYSDLCYGYNAFWRHCLPAMSVDCPGFEVETLINIRVARAGLVVSEVASFERARIHGQSNLKTFRDGWRVLRTIGRERLRSTHQHRHVQAELERLATDGLGVQTTVS